MTLAAGALAAVVVGVQYTRPVFVGRTTVVQRLAESPRRSAPVVVDSIALHAPWIHRPAELAVRTPQFERDRAAFFSDLLGTGKLTGERAARIADAAVRQAYAERVPPALVLGVMLTENDEFKPTARSRVGAVGLMQIMPRVWRTRTLRERFGTNLRDDATNVRYGVFILGHFSRSVPDSATEQSSWRKALIYYNGCVTGRNTRGCHRYPDVVRRHVQRTARASCGGRSFDDCVVKPFWLAMQVRDERARGD